MSKVSGSTRQAEEEAVQNVLPCSLEVSEEVIDPDVLKIVAFTVNESRTVKQIASALNIPLVKCYELVDWMERKGFLVETGKVRTATHGLAKLYISTVSHGSIELRNGKLVITCHHKTGETRVKEEDIVPSKMD